MERLSGTYCIPFSPEPLDVAGLFSGRPVVCEIGFGTGIATAEIADQNPEIGYLGIEVYPAGVARLLLAVEARGLENIKIIRHDAREVLTTMIPDRSLSGLHIFFPDPWPKRPHHKRRLLQSELLPILAAKLEPGGYVYAVTDWEDYARQILALFSGHPAFHNDHEAFAPSFGWRPVTKFEERARREGRGVREILVRRV